MAKRGGPGGSSPPTKKSAKNKTGEAGILCLKCNKCATEDSVECECCFKWEHRTCAGISEDKYEILSNSSPNIMFFCSFCRPKVALALKFFNEIKQKQKSLDEKVKELEETVNTLVSSSANTNVETAQPLETLSANTNTDISVATNKAVPPPKPPPLVADKRYNVVVYGLEESPKDTPRANRLKHDLEKLLNVLSGIDASLTATSIQDFHRLGKFKPNNTRLRPLLVKFLRTFEASLVLSKKDSLASSQVSTKRDVTRGA